MTAKLFKLLLVLTTLIFSTSTLAQSQEAALKRLIQERFPKASIDKVTKSPYFGLYEVSLEGQIIYTDEKFNYFIDGSVIDARTLSNVTEERKRQLGAIKLENIPLDWSFKRVKGNGKRKLVLFSDPDCPYCKVLEKELAQISDVTIYTFLFPIEQLHPNATDKSKAIWCSKDPAKSWTEVMLNNADLPQDKSCDNPVDKIVAYAKKHRISGTPTLFFADGQRVPGAISKDNLEKLLNSAEKKK